MANEQNLRPFDTLTEKEQREIRSKGGKASGEARKQRADLRKALETLLEGKTPNGTTYQEDVALGLLQNAINGKKGGNPKAFEVIAKMIGQYDDTTQVEIPKLEIEIVDNEKEIQDGE